ncbi:MAG: GNAT family N-acetyltransferase [Oscillospiraceae bacterium]|nr:GNAT family N-acetyltransferase [Oscillospiraceae bacterium]
MYDPYMKCPIFETKDLILRLVEKTDAEDLLECYSDKVAQKFFNDDNCLNNFKYKTLEEMNKAVDFWISAYNRGDFIRFSIVDKQSKKAVGTLEMFGGPQGVLRIDIKSEYEKREYLNQIVEVSINSFYSLFITNRIITKAIPKATERIAALKNYGFNKDKRRNYYYRDNK